MRINIDAANLRRCHEILAGATTGSFREASRRNDAQNEVRDHAFARQWISMADKGYLLDDYSALFEFKGSSLSGDVTPAYSGLAEQEIQYIQSAFPRLAIILLFRDPVSRAWSSFNMNIRRQLMSRDDWRSGDVALRMKEKASLEELQRFMNVHENRQRSFHSVSYGRWVSVFGLRQVHVTFFQDIIRRPEGVIEDICAQLGVVLQSPPVPALNAKMTVPRTEMNSDHAEFLGDHFRSEYRAMRELFPERASEWIP